MSLPFSNTNYKPPRKCRHVLERIERPALIHREGSVACMECGAEIRKIPKAADRQAEIISHLEFFLQEGKIEPAFGGTTKLVFTGDATLAKQLIEQLQELSEGVEQVASI